MGLLIFPVLLLLTIGPGAGASPQALADFSRFSKAINREVVIVDMDGTVREGVITAATADDVSVRFGGGTKTFSRATVASAERTRDGRIDGAVKGAVFGTLLGLLTMQVYEDRDERLGAWLGSVAIYGGIGYALDAAQTHRQPLYRSAAMPAPAAAIKLSLRF